MLNFSNFSKAEKHFASSLPKVTFLQSTTHDTREKIVMKKINQIVTGIVSLTLMAALIAISPCRAADKKELVSIKKDGVNIRSGPSKKTPVRWEVFKGFPLQVLERKNDWAHTIDFENDEGWVYSSLIEDTKTMIVKVDTANMRSGPGKDYDIIATAKRGVIFTPVDKKDGWVKVRYKNNITGWIFNTLLWPAQ